MATGASPKPRPGLMPEPRRSGEPSPSTEVAEAVAHYPVGGAGPAMHQETYPPLGGGDGLLANVRRGLSFAAAEALAGAIGSQRELAKAVAIPTTTLARRKSAGRLTPAESDRLVRIARVVDLARALMRGDLDAARSWLTTPHELLAGESPLHRASTETGARDVEQLVGRLRHGVFG